ncbi:MAG: TetR/AcrR family transcriptional regulator [Alphaproteobacteria bacterium]|jgi:TetR/AcrR family transcriptional regulator, transcriptional repressor for nem operon|nr:TetR/AcrR family transcriptional regulator [Alphaproteobacteria bacterium]
MPWEKQFNEEEVLEKAMLAFWRDGFEATSMKSLVDCMGINPGSIYAAFGNKKDLFKRTLDHYDDQVRDFLTAVEEKNGPHNAIVAVFEHMTEEVRSNPDNCGCFMANSVLEGAPKDKEIDRIVQKSMEEFQGFFSRMINEGQKNGEINAGLDPIRTARILQSLVIGCRAMTRGRSDSSVLEDVTEHVRNFLK